MGNHEEANTDADTALKDNTEDVQALLAKAEAQYHQGSFEHALIYFFRSEFFREMRKCSFQTILKSS